MPNLDICFTEQRDERAFSSTRNTHNRNNDITLAKRVTTVNNVLLSSPEEQDLRECDLFATGLDLSRMFSCLLCLLCLLIVQGIRLVRETRWALWSASGRTCRRSLRPIHVNHFEKSDL